MAEIFLKDTATKALTTREDLEKVLEYTDKDIHVTPYIFECASVGMNTPILAAQYAGTSNDVKFCTGQSVKAQAECSIETMQEAMDDMGIFLVFPKGDKYVLLPLRYTAYLSVCQRAGIAGTSIMNFEATKLLDVLPVNEKATWLSRGFSLHKASCNILIREEKVSAMLSQGYVVLPDRELVEALEKQLKQDTPDFQFNSGEFSHEYLVADYNCNDDTLDVIFKDLMERFGVKCDSIKCGIRFTTSDIGNSCAKAIPMYRLNETVIVLGKSVALKHAGDSSLDIWANELTKLMAAFKENEDRVEELGNTDINHPADCLKNILKAHQNLVSGSEGVIQKLSAMVKCTAIDIYIALNEIIEAKNTKKPLSPTALVQYSEEVAGLLFADFRAYDHKCED